MSERSDQRAPATRPRATFKRAPEDFVVEEIDAYPTTGEGEHVYVRVRKRGLTTDAALDRLARALGVDPRACGAAGMKDREAIATQRLSLHGTTEAAVQALAGRFEDLEILEVGRHANKLRPGHLRGNRFTIRLRDLDEDAARGVERALLALAPTGFPNAFGPQRFGRDGDNADRALAFVRGESPPPRDARLRRLLFSALQARWFNRVLEDRVREGTFATPLVGDVLQKLPAGGMFVCEDASVDGPRAAAFEISPTGPMFGPKMARPAGEVLARELAALAGDRLGEDDLLRHRALGEGTRRPLRVVMEGLAVEQAPFGLIVRMTLPRGAYATTALAQVAELVQPRERLGDEAAPDDRPTEPDPDAGG